MRLVWHIVRKDLRRFALPIAVWLLTLTGPTILGLSTPKPEGHLALNLEMMLGAQKTAVRFMDFALLLFGYLLAGSIVLEDSLAGSAEFWKTRPVSGARLMAAKGLGAACVLVILPLIVLTFVWCANGFGWADLTAATGSFFVAQARLLLLALALAALSRSLAQFVLYTLVLIGVAGGCIAVSELMVGIVPPHIRASRDLLALRLIPVVALLVIPLQFLARRSRDAWTLIGLAFIAFFFIRVAWPWDVVSGARTSRHAARFQERLEDRAAAVVVEPTFRKSRPDSSEMPNLFGRTAWVAGGFYAPTFAKTSDGFYAMRSSGVWEGEAGLRLLGFKHDDSLRCQLIGAQWPKRNAENPELVGALEIWFVRPRIVGEAPLRVGEHFQSGANLTRVLFLERNESNRLDAVFIEERDSETGALAGWGSNWTPGDAQRSVHIDQYCLVNRAKQKAQALYGGGIGAIDLNAVVVQYRRLHVAGEDDWGDGTLVKIRFECDHRFERPLVVRGIQYGPAWSSP